MATIDYPGIGFEQGTLVSPAHVKEDGTIEPAQYTGGVPMNITNMNKMDATIKEIVNNMITYEVIEETEE